MADVIFGFVIMVICTAAAALFMFIAAAYFGAILDIKKAIADAEHVAEVKSEKALEEFLREYEIEGRTMEEWFGLLKRWEAENGTERTDETPPDR